jgi:hypothetical protein
MECPKCGFNQPSDQYCAQCGIHIQNALKARQRKAWLGSILVVCLCVATGMILFRRQVVQEEGNPGRIVAESGKQRLASSPATRSSPPAEAPTTSRTRAGTRPPQTSLPAQMPKAPPAAFTAPPPVKNPRPARAADREPPRVLAESVGTKVPKPMSAQRKGSPAEQPEAVDPERQLRKWAAQEWFAKGQELADNSEDELFMYEKALEVNPHFAPAYYYSGLIYLEWGEYEEAVAAFRQFLAAASEAEKAVYPLPEEVSPDDVLPAENAENSH